MVSIDITMNQQINLRLPAKLLSNASAYASRKGFANVQELIKETLREKLFPEAMLSKKELFLVKKLIEASEKDGLFGTEEDLFGKLKR